MKTFALKEKRPAPATVRRRPYVHTPFGPMQRAQQARIGRILRSTSAQAKLTIGQPNDRYEQEADRVADKVMAMPDPRLQRQPENEEEEETLRTKPLADQITPLVQRQEEPPEEEEEALQAKFWYGETVQRQPEEEEEEQLQTKEQPGRTPQVASNIESRISSMKSGGQPLDPAARSFFEPRFGRDFSDVRLHTDSAAVDTARSIHARAYTLGNHIAMGSNEYQLRSQSGQRLLGHELTHVIQQSGETAHGLSNTNSIQRNGEPLTQTNFNDWAALAISDYEEAANQGLEDFEHNVSEGANWGVIAANIIGNVVWAASVFAGPAEVPVFFVSMAGVAAGSIPTVGATSGEFDLAAFHRRARNRISNPDPNIGIVAELQRNVGTVTADLVRQANTGGWSEQQARHELLLRLVESDSYIRNLGNLPMLDKRAVAAKTEAELSLRAANTRWNDFLGWVHGNGYVDYVYAIDHVFSTHREANQPSEWTPRMSYVWIFPLSATGGSGDFPRLNERLNNIYGNILHSPMNISDWPIRKRLSILLRPMVGQVWITLDESNNVIGQNSNIDHFTFRRMGIDSPEERAQFPVALMRWLWRDSGGSPPSVNQLFTFGHGPQ